MAQKWSAFASKLQAQASGVATAMGGGTTQAEVEGLAAIFTVLSKRNDLAQPPTAIANTKVVTPG